MITLLGIKTSEQSISLCAVIMFHRKLKENYLNGFKLEYYSPLGIWGQKCLENVICINIHLPVNR